MYDITQQQNIQTSDLTAEYTSDVWRNNTSDRDPRTTSVLPLLLYFNPWNKDWATFCDLAQSSELRHLSTQTGRQCQQVQVWPSQPRSLSLYRRTGEQAHRCGDSGTVPAYFKRIGKWDRGDHTHVAAARADAHHGRLLEMDPGRPDGAGRHSHGR